MKIEEQLMVFISQHEEIFNTQHPKYSDNKLKNELWDQIADKLDSSPECCKKRWKNLRDSYRKFIRTENNHKRKYRYAEELRFLKPYLKKRIKEEEEASNDTIENEEIQQHPVKEEIITRRKHKIMQNKKENINKLKRKRKDKEAGAQQPQPPAKLFITNIKKQPDNKDGKDKDNAKKNKTPENENDEDGLKQLFSSMYQTVKKFPNKLQAETKRQLFQVISDAELKFLEIKNSIKQ